MECSLLINSFLDELTQFLQTFCKPFFLHDLGCRSEDKIRVRSDPMINLWNELASFAAYLAKEMLTPIAMTLLWSSSVVSVSDKPQVIID